MSWRVNSGAVHSMVVAQRVAQHDCCRRTTEALSHRTVHARLIDTHHYLLRPLRHCNGQCWGAHTTNQATGVSHWHTPSPDVRLGSHLRAARTVRMQAPALAGTRRTSPCQPPAQQEAARCGSTCRKCSRDTGAGDDRTPARHTWFIATRQHETARGRYVSHSGARECARGHARTVSGRACRHTHLRARLR